jgi:peptidyl-prolyl cis-trans isomerase SurA
MFWRFSIFVLFAVSLTRAEIIDRIAVSVGDRVITTSDVAQEIRVTAFLNGVKPDFSPQNKRSTADRMVEQTLVRQELETSRYPAPQLSDIEAPLDNFKKQYYPTDDSYRQALAEYGITDAQVKDELLWQRTLLEFVDVRFRPGVQVTDQEVQDYFNRVVVPAARAAHPNQPVALEDFRAQIEQTLAGQREDRDMETWLTQARRRTRIVYHDEAFQ